VLITALGSWEKHREGDPEEWSAVLVTALGSWGKHTEGDPKGWSTVLVTALSSVLENQSSAAKCTVYLIPDYSLQVR
jgi:hypothetical protein